MKVGYIAILGRSNVGKSTLLNALLSKKVSSVSRRAQTTRDSILGILNSKDSQIVFVDTPGITRQKGELSSHMRKQAYSYAREVEAILYLIDANCKDLQEDINLIKGIKTISPIILILNKIDLINVTKGERIKASLKEVFPDKLLIETSILKNYGLKQIKEAINPYLQDGEPYFPIGTLTDKDLSYQVKEVIREKMLLFLNDEIPHHSAVKVKSLLEEKNAYYIKAEIIIDKKSHKKILIGSNGSMIKKISMSSRKELEARWKRKIASLEVVVKVKENWQSDLKSLKELGYAD